ncbi:hypothetical protein PVAP13_6KG106535 [Panicum virgatum]|uniref:Uncharacterized protein n=1 Tax=Panicum virgatum TaxID=38727 RepID=A0A8T0RBW4_PANVG|nr:hypothetical protein PVAP13_6KG106535 [Panicum virgatum]
MGKGLGFGQRGRRGVDEERARGRIAADKDVRGTRMAGAWHEVGRWRRRVWRAEQNREEEKGFAAAAAVQPALPFSTARWAPTAPGPRLLRSRPPSPPGSAPPPRVVLVSKASASRTTRHPVPLPPRSAGAEHLPSAPSPSPSSSPRPRRRPHPHPPRLPPLAGPGMASRGGDPRARASR